MRGRRTRAELGIRRVFVCAALLLSGVADGHEPSPKPASAPSPALAPGYGELGFRAPEPGSYALPPLGEAADGRVLTSQGGETTLHEVFGDRLVLLSFVYARCSDVNGCPLATSVFQRVKTRLRSEPEIAGRLRLVSLSFDPEHDTPEVMRRYGEAFRGAGMEWRFLTTASPVELEPILEAYGQHVQSNGEDPSGALAHVLRVFLIDAHRRIRNVYTVSYLHPDVLVSDVKTLLMEPDSVRVPRDPGGRGRFHGPGDDRAGYERATYRTRSVALAARRGVPADLLARARATQLGLPPLPVPEDNPLTAEKVQLGRKLFFDRRLSGNGTFSCAMCHIPEQGFTSHELRTAVGIEGRTVRRNSPTLYNVAYLSRLFHDGRETRLEHQVWAPLLARNEMGNPSIGFVIETIRSLPDYAGLFEAAFPDRGLRMETIGMALASYQRTLVAAGSAFDRWRYARESDALPEEARRGFRLFVGKARCAACHLVGDQYALLTDGDFHNTGAGILPSAPDGPGPRRIQVAPGRFLSVDASVLQPVSEARPTDLGRYEITQDPHDRWAYRTPTLRNVALTPPYMHDGSLGSLRDVVEFYDRGGVANETLDPLMAPIGLDDTEKQELVAFLESLTGADVDVLVADAFAAPVGETGAVP